MKLLKEHGHDVVAYRLVKDEPAQITEEIRTSVGNDAIQAIIINGGTGISRRDSTFEAVDSMLEKRLDGFGEVFRYLTYQEIGSPAIMTRATAGIVQGKVLFSTPGSEDAVRLAMQPTPLPAAMINTSSPGFTSARTYNMCTAVTDTRGNAAPSANDRESGSDNTFRAGTATSSA